ncbi:hypothetical protein T310_9395 [Rasamsonia emersonii CBS 393.64]|uniref:Poly(A) RNA polymerase mitochondrial-like central palm domain-containing protein n=1 Tax=Rasamsonia emersonii (strain ATCC 16479 / CBS 393.64 / IMI 116815) TaxID=1408163 RepID=A0A0F4YFQ3_RASE3|nr:hypothetical protein T310_9395 [Rasamsonia emersonii CBS 393.64]KKA16989.1 hypothetical protein T310_9395 [Rasamsonia emersonii CBS 393.64]
MPRWGRRPALCLSPVGSLSTLLVRFYQFSGFKIKNPYPVFRNSLRKTLEAQRAVNRSRLIRKVYYDKPSPNIFRPAIPKENLAGQQQVAAESENDSPSNQTAVTARVHSTRPQSPRRGRRVLRRPNPRESISTPLQSLSWNVDESAQRPAQYPWLELLHSNTDDSDGLSRLDAEIRSLEEFLSPSNQEQVAIEQIVQDLSTLVAGVVPHAPQVVGSRHTGMALAHSNLDIIIAVDDPDLPTDGDRRPSPMRPQAVKAYWNTLRAAEAALRQSSVFDHIHLSQDRIPAITMVHHATGIPLRVYCAEEPPAALEYIKNYQMEHPALRPLYMTLRMILDVRGNFGASRSSIGPYGLLMLITAVLKLHPRPPNSLGEQLLDILHTYGTAVNLETTGVAVDPPGFFDFATVRRQEDVARETGEEPPYLRGQRALLRFKVRARDKANHPAARHLCIQDPTNYLNDAGWPCVRTAELQGAMADAYQRLRAAVDAWDGNDDRAPESILGQALQANFDDLKQLRSRIGKLS